MTSWVAAARTADVPVGRVVVCPVGDHAVALCNVDGEFFAVDDLCTHDNGPLDQGELDGYDIECPRHGARFDVRSGRVTQLPAFVPIATHPVRVQGDTIEIADEHA